MHGLDICFSQGGMMISICVHSSVYLSRNRLPCAIAVSVKVRTKYVRSVYLMVTHTFVKLNGWISWTGDRT